MGNYTSSIIGKDPSKKYKLKDKKDKEEMEGGAPPLTKDEINAIINETRRLNKLFDSIDKTEFKTQKERTEAIRKIVEKKKKQKNNN